MRRDAFFDIAANVPILVYLTTNFMFGNNDEHELDDDGEYSWQFYVCASLVHLRLFHIGKVSFIIKTLFAKLQLIFYLHLITL